MNRLKVAELTSGSGALVLGVGLGTLLSRRTGRVAVPITLVGVAMHAFGMWDKHRLDASKADVSPAWVPALYWVCWALLAVVLSALLFRGW